MRWIKKRVIWILAIIISQVLKNAITIHLIGNLPLLFCFPLTLALFYVWSVARPTCRCRISVWARIAPVREDKAEQHAPVLLCRPRSSLALFSFFPLLRRTPAPPAIADVAFCTSRRRRSRHLPLPQTSGSQVSGAAAASSSSADWGIKSPPLHPLVECLDCQV